jgi:hypothetical protein
MMAAGEDIDASSIGRDRGSMLICIVNEMTRYPGQVVDCWLLVVGCWLLVAVDVRYHVSRDRIPFIVLFQDVSFYFGHKSLWSQTLGNFT